MVRSITSKDTNCKCAMLECKGEAKRQPSFSRGIGSLATTINPRCGTQVTKTRVAATSQVTKTRALSRSLRLPSPAWWRSNIWARREYFGHAAVIMACHATHLGTIDMDSFQSPSGYSHSFTSKTHLKKILSFIVTFRKFSALPLQKNVEAHRLA
jgi:hypothetical protein